MELAAARPRLATVQTPNSEPPRAPSLRRVVVLGLILAVAAGACSAAAQGLSLTGRTFLSTGVTVDGVPKPLVAGTRVRLIFDGEGLSASAGCNLIGGTYRVTGTTLEFTGAGMTEMGCDQDLHDQDEWLASLLAEKPTVSLVGNKLTLTSNATVVELLDREVVEPDANLVGPTWTVVSIVSGDSVSSVPADAVATLDFAQDGTVAVNTGCNQGQGRWALAGSGLSITEVMLTKKACAGAEAQLESAVLAVLGEGMAASIEANMLTLNAGVAGLQLRAD